MTCPYCAKEDLEETATVCTRCGRVLAPQPTATIRKPILFVVAGIVVLMVFLLFLLAAPS